MARLLSPFQMKKQVCVDLEKSRKKVFVYDIAVSRVPNPTTIVTSSSKNSIQTFDRNTLAPLSELEGHRDTITGIATGNTDSNLVWSCSEDQSVLLWDLRTNKPALSYKMTRTDLVPASCAVNCIDGAIAVGTNLATTKKHKDALLTIWDVRKTEPLTVFQEAHSDDITQVKFHPTNPKACASCATDGLVNFYDLGLVPATGDPEDEAIISTVNSDTSMSRIGYFGPNGEYLYGLTHHEEYNCWHATPREDENENECVVHFADLREAIAKQGVTVNYFVQNHYDAASQRLYLVGGTHDGQLLIFHVNQGSVSFAAALSGGHSATVRDVHWLPDNNGIISGGEDGMLTLWSREEIVGTNEDNMDM